MPALPPGGPYTLTANAGADTATASDVLVGDVFLCSGQSNMAFSQRQADGAAEDARTATDGEIRSLDVPAAGSLTPRRTLQSRRPLGRNQPRDGRQFLGRVLLLRA